MTTTPQITRQTLPNGQYRYEVDGTVHTKRSNRLYTHASAYRVTAAGDEHQANNPWAEGNVLVWLHSRADLAAKGSPVGDWAVKTGRAVKLPVVEIQDVTA